MAYSLIGLSNWALIKHIKLFLHIVVLMAVKLVSLSGPTPRDVINFVVGSRFERLRN